MRKRPLQFARESTSGHASEAPGSRLRNLYIEALPIDSPYPTALVSAPGVKEALELQKPDPDNPGEFIPSDEGILAMAVMPAFQRATDHKQYKVQREISPNELSVIRLVVVGTEGTLAEAVLPKQLLDLAINRAAGLPNPLERLLLPATQQVLAGSFDLDDDGINPDIKDPVDITQILDFFWVPDNSGENQSHIYAYSGRSGSYWPTKTIEGGFDPDGNRINFEAITARYEDEDGDPVAEADNAGALPVLYARTTDTQIRRVETTKDGIGAGNPVAVHHGAIETDTHRWRIDEESSPSKAIATIKATGVDDPTLTFDLENVSYSGGFSSNTHLFFIKESNPRIGVAYKLNGANKPTRDEPNDTNLFQVSWSAGASTEGGGFYLIENPFGQASKALAFELTAQGVVSRRAEFDIELGPGDWTGAFRVGSTGIYFINNAAVHNGSDPQGKTAHYYNLRSGQAPQYDGDRNINLEQVAGKDWVSGWDGGTNYYFVEKGGYARAFSVGTHIPVANSDIWLTRKDWSWRIQGVNNFWLINEDGSKAEAYDKGGITGTVGTRTPQDDITPPQGAKFSWGFGRGQHGENITIFVDNDTDIAYIYDFLGGEQVDGSFYGIIGQIQLTAGDSYTFGTATATHNYFCNNTANKLEAYVEGGGRPTPARNIVLAAGNTVDIAVGTDGTLWVLRNSNPELLNYNSDGTRNPAKEHDFGRSAVPQRLFVGNDGTVYARRLYTDGYGYERFNAAGVFLGTGPAGVEQPIPDADLYRPHGIYYEVDNANNMALARNSNDESRNQLRDFSLGEGDWKRIVLIDENTALAFNATNNTAVAFTLDAQVADDNNDVALDAGDWTTSTTNLTANRIHIINNAAKRTHARNATDMTRSGNQDDINLNGVVANGDWTDAVNFTGGNSANFYIYNQADNTNYAFQASDDEPQGSDNIQLATAGWTGVSQEATAIRIIDNAENKTRAYHTSGWRNPGQDDSLDPGNWTAGLRLRGKRYLVDNITDRIVPIVGDAFDIQTTDFGRPFRVGDINYAIVGQTAQAFRNGVPVPDENIELGFTATAGFVCGEYLVFVDDAGDRAVFLEYSEENTRWELAPSKNIALGPGTWTGGYCDDQWLYFVSEPAGGTATTTAWRYAEHKNWVRAYRPPEGHRAGARIPEKDYLADLDAIDPLRDEQYETQKAGITFPEETPYGGRTYEINADGTQVEARDADRALLPLGYTSEPVSVDTGGALLKWARIAHNGRDALIATDKGTYLWDVAHESWSEPQAFRELTERERPLDEQIIDVDWIDGYLFWATASGKFGHSEPDSIVFDPLVFANAESSPDGLVGIASWNRRLFLLGSESLEIWVNTGAANFTFARQQGVTHSVGCASRKTIAANEDGVFFVANNNRVYMLGNGLTGISTPSVEYDIEISDKRQAKAFMYQEEGHRFYVLTLTAGDMVYSKAGEYSDNGSPICDYRRKCWCYDTRTQLWHERDLEWVNAHVYAFNEINLVAGEGGGQIRELKREYLNSEKTDEDGMPVPVKFHGAAPTLHANQARTALQEVEFVIVPDKVQGLDKDDFTEGEAYLRLVKNRAYIMPEGSENHPPPANPNDGYMRDLNNIARKCRWGSSGLGVFSEAVVLLEIQQPDKPFVIKGVYYRGDFSTEFGVPEAPIQGH